MWGAAGEVRALRSLVKRVAASELEIAAAEADEAAAHWTAMVRRPSTHWMIYHVRKAFTS